MCEWVARIIQEHRDPEIGFLFDSSSSLCSDCRRNCQAVFFEQFTHSFRTKTWRLMGHWKCMWTVLVSWVSRVFRYEREQVKLLPVLGTFRNSTKRFIKVLLTYNKYRLKLASHEQEGRIPAESHRPTWNPESLKAPVGSVQTLACRTLGSSPIEIYDGNGLGRLRT